MRRRLVRLLRRRRVQHRGADVRGSLSGAGVDARSGNTRPWRDDLPRARHHDARSGDDAVVHCDRIAQGATIEVAAATMANRKISCLPVMDGNVLVGIVTTYDLLDALANRLRAQK